MPPISLAAVIVAALAIGGWLLLAAAILLDDAGHAIDLDRPVTARRTLRIASRILWSAIGLLLAAAIVAGLAAL